MPVVVITDATRGLKPALHEISAPHSGVGAVTLRSRGTVCIKPNGIHVTPHAAHGHFPPTSLLGECVISMDILASGSDTLSVGFVGARALGHGLQEVEHSRLCAEWMLGEGDIRHGAAAPAPVLLHASASLAAGPDSACLRSWFRSSPMKAV